MEKQPPSEDQFLTAVNQIIEENIDNESFSVEDLAQNIRISQSMLHRKLKKLTGKSTNEYITEIRLARAREFLENDVATVSEIAYRVGFKDPSYFIKVFKKYYKVSPGNVKRIPHAGLIQPSMDQQKEPLKSIKSKVYRLLLKLVVIILIVILLGGGIYYLIRIRKPREKSLAVLPLHNLTGNPENAYLVDGMHDALIGELGRIESLRVISRTSTLQYRNSEKTLKEIAQELGVKTILEGSVTAAGDTLRILLQMIDVFPKERHLLTNEYFDDMHHVLTIHSTAVKDIADKIKIRLSKEEEQLLAKLRTVDPETYKAYLRGMYYLNQGTQESFETGLSHLRKAIERDPADPFAYAGLALGYAIMGHGMLYSERSFRLATAAANKALLLDPTLDEAYTALALLYLYQSWDWQMAKDAFESAIDHNPNNEIAHAHFAWYHVLFGDMKQSIYHARKAVELEPFSPSYSSWLAWLYYHNSEYDEAEYWAKESLALNENLPYGNLVLGWIYLNKKQYHKAIETHEKLPFNTVRWKWLRCRTYVLTGDREKALAIWNEVKEHSQENWTNPFYTGMIAGTLGFTDTAFELLKEACEEKYYPASLINVFPSVEFIRDDPRFNTLLQKLNLPYNTLLTAQN